VDCLQSIVLVLAYLHGQQDFGVGGGGLDILRDRTLAPDTMASSRMPFHLINNAVRATSGVSTIELLYDEQDQVDWRTVARSVNGPLAKNIDNAAAKAATARTCTASSSSFRTLDMLRRPQSLKRLAGVMAFVASDRCAAESG
jgi:hypothetical protein